MKRYKVSDGITVEDPQGEFVTFDDVIERLFMIQIENQEALISAEKMILEALKEIRELKKELQLKRTS